MIGAAYIGAIACRPHGSSGGGDDSYPDIGGLLLRLDASDPATITQSSGRVSQVADKSGNNNHAVQPSADRQPAIVAAAQNGLSVIDFGDYERVTATGNFLSLPAVAGKTFVMVLQARHGGGMPFAASSTYPLHRGMDGALSHEGRSPYAAIFSPTLADVDFRNGNVRKNGFALGATTEGIYAGWQILVIRSAGAEAVIDRLFGDRNFVYGGAVLGEAAVFDSILSDADVETLEGYYAEKWGLSKLLPASHPHSTASWETLPVVTAAPNFWIDPSDTDACYTVDGAVVQLTDKSGSRNAAIRRGIATLTESVEPATALQNGRAAADFGVYGSSKTLSFSPVSAKTFAVVLDSTQAGGFFFGARTTFPFHRGGTGSLTTNTILDANASTAVRSGVTRKNGAAINPTTTPIGAGWQILVFRTDGTAVTIDQMFMDRNTQSRTGGAVCGDMLTFPDVLSDSDTEALEGYLAHKWGLASLLPGGHPYKSSPP